MIHTHLDISLIKTPKVECNSICAFTGEKIQFGYAKKDLVLKTFTDFEYIKYNSEWVSEKIALYLSRVIPSGKGKFNGLRNYSFYADREGYRLLKREEILDMLLNIQSDEFQICVTYSNKKHIAFKSQNQTNPKLFTVSTDVGNVLFDVEKTTELLPTLNNWYRILEGNTSKQQPTYFTKAEILGETKPQFKKIKQYGIKKFFEENEKIEQFRKTEFLKLLVHILNKTK